MNRIFTIDARSQGAGAMSLDYIRNHYGVPASLGAAIVYYGDSSEGKEGVIVGSDGARILALLRGRDSTSILHPTWKVNYPQYNQ